MLDNINDKTKIRSCKLNNEERQSLKNAHEILKLKLELNSKKNY